MTSSVVLCAAWICLPEVCEMAKLLIQPLILGAVAYDPKVVTIWEGFKEYFAKQDFAFDYVLYSNYESQVLGHFDGQCHVAWNSPLAWIEAERLATKRGRKAS